MAILALAALPLAGAAASLQEHEAGGEARPRLTYMGLGEIRVGMQEQQALALGFQQEQNGAMGSPGDPDYASCHYLHGSTDYPEIALMVNDGRVVRIDIQYDAPGGLWQSWSGVTTGMTEAEVAALYGKRLKRSDHPYLGSAGSYLRLDRSDGRYAMIFETSNLDGDGKEGTIKRVTTFRSGFADAVGYIEGCA